MANYSIVSCNKINELPFHSRKSNGIYRNSMCHSGGKRKKNSFHFIFIMYMINYCIAPDYQKIVRDIIFHMYLISVHVETYALEGPNARLFFGEKFQLRALTENDSEADARKESLGLPGLVSGDASLPQIGKNHSQPVARISPQPANTRPIYQIYIRLIKSHIHSDFCHSFPSFIVSHLFMSCFLMPLSGGSVLLAL